MPIATPLLNGYPEDSGRKICKLLDYDVLEIIISVYVLDGIKDTVTETQEAALRRQRRCVKLSRVSRLFKVCRNVRFSRLRLRSV
jgi:hypothetical protein